MIIEIYVKGVGKACTRTGAFLKKPKGVFKTDEDDWNCYGENSNHKKYGSKDQTCKG